MKTCAWCGQTKPETEFYRLSSGNLRAECKLCKNAKRMADYAESKNPRPRPTVRTRPEWLALKAYIAGVPECERRPSRPPLLRRGYVTHGIGRML